MIKFKHHGNFSNIERFLSKASKGDLLSGLEKYAEAGVKALASATPVDTGKTSESWGYEISKDNGSFTIHWTNSNVNDGVNIALILQYGHGNGNGGYIKGIDYINPAIRPIFDDIAEKAWKEVTSA